LLIKFENNYGHQNQWFTDALRTAATAWGIDKMGDDWTVGKSPYPHWDDYGVHLKSYSTQVIANPRAFADADAFAEWFKPQLPTPQGATHTIAARLLPVFQKNPEYWEAIEYINIGQDKDATFQKYMEQWYKNLPERLRPAVQAVATAMGFRKN